MWSCHLMVLQPESTFYHLSELLFHQSISISSPQPWGSMRQVFHTWHLLKRTDCRPARPRGILLQPKGTIPDPSCGQGHAGRLHGCPHHLLDPQESASARDESWLKEQQMHPSTASLPLPSTLPSSPALLPSLPFPSPSLSPPAFSASRLSLAPQRLAQPAQEKREKALDAPVGPRATG